MQKRNMALSQGDQLKQLYHVKIGELERRRATIRRQIQEQAAADTAESNVDEPTISNFGDQNAASSYVESIEEITESSDTDSSYHYKRHTKVKRKPVQNSLSVVPEHNLINRKHPASRLDNGKLVEKKELLPKSFYHNMGTNQNYTPTSPNKSPTMDRINGYKLDNQIKFLQPSSNANQASTHSAFTSDSSSESCLTDPEIQPSPPLVYKEFVSPKGLIKVAQPTLPPPPYKDSNLVSSTQYEFNGNLLPSNTKASHINDTKPTLKHHQPQCVPNALHHEHTLPNQPAFGDVWPEQRGHRVTESEYTETSDNDSIALEEILAKIVRKKPSPGVSAIPQACITKISPTQPKHGTAANTPVATYSNPINQGLRIEDNPRNSVSAQDPDWYKRHRVGDISHAASCVSTKKPEHHPSISKYDDEKSGYSSTDVDYYLGPEDIKRIKARNLELLHQQKQKLKAAEGNLPQEVQKLKQSKPAPKLRSSPEISPVSSTGPSPPRRISDKNITTNRQKVPYFVPPKQYQHSSTFSPHKTARDEPVPVPTPRIKQEAYSSGNTNVEAKDAEVEPADLNPTQSLSIQTSCQHPSDSQEPNITVDTSTQCCPTPLPRSKSLVNASTDAPVESVNACTSALVQSVNACTSALVQSVNACTDVPVESAGVANQQTHQSPSADNMDSPTESQNIETVKEAHIPTVLVQSTSDYITPNNINKEDNCGNVAANQVAHKFNQSIKEEFAQSQQESNMELPFSPEAATEERCSTIQNLITGKSGDLPINVSGQRETSSRGADVRNVSDINQTGTGEKFKQIYLKSALKSRSNKADQDVNGIPTDILKIKELNDQLEEYMHKHTKSTPATPSSSQILQSGMSNEEIMVRMIEKTKQKMERVVQTMTKSGTEEKLPALTEAERLYTLLASTLNVNLMKEMQHIEVDKAGEYNTRELSSYMTSVACGLMELCCYLAQPNLWKHGCLSETSDSHQDETNSKTESIPKRKHKYLTNHEMMKSMADADDSIVETIILPSSKLNSRGGLKPPSTKVSPLSNRSISLSTNISNSRTRSTGLVKRTPNKPKSRTTSTASRTKQSVKSSSSPSHCATTPRPTLRQASRISANRKTTFKNSATSRTLPAKPSRSSSKIIQSKPKMKTPTKAKKLKKIIPADAIPSSWKSILPPCNRQVVPKSVPKSKQNSPYQFDTTPYGFLSYSGQPKRKHV